MGRPSGVEVTKQTFPETPEGLVRLATFLSEVGATVAMEATGVYWKSVYYALEGLVSQLCFCNAQHVKSTPVRKTDLSGAEWFADVAIHGMLRPSMVPSPEIRQLGDCPAFARVKLMLVSRRSNA